MADELKQPDFLSFLPMSLYGAVMSMTGLSFVWGWAERTFSAPFWISKIFAVLAVVIFVAVTIAYLLKCIKYPALVKKEFDHPVSISFFGMPIISLLLLPGIIIHHSESLAIIIWCIGAVLMFLFAWFVLRKWLDHPQDPGNALPVWVIPVVGTLDVPVVGYSLPFQGAHEICLVFFSIGILFAIIFMTIVFSRLLFQPPLPEAIQPSLLILVVPFALAFSGYESISGVQDTLATVFFYFDIFLFLLLGSKIIYLPVCCPFRVSWWAVGFPLAAITISAFRYASHKTGVIYHVLPTILLIITTVTICCLFFQSIYKLLIKQFLLPNPVNEKATRLLVP